MDISSLHHILSVNEFFVEGNSRGSSHVLLHITEPSTDAERERGYFFALIETKNASEAYLLELQNAIDDIEQKYYEAENEHPGTLLERVLEDLNQRSEFFINTGITLHATVGVIRQPEIFFTSYGEPLLLLFYKNRTGIYERMNLIGDEEIAPEKTPLLFTQIIQGKISKGDYLFIGTKSIGTYFHTDRLHKIITTRSGSEGAEHLKKVLSDISSGSSFGGLVVTIHTGERPATFSHKPLITTPETRKPTTENSLFLAEQKTAATLSPSFSLAWGEKLKQWSKTIGEKKPQPILNKERPPLSTAPHIRPYQGTTPKNETFSIRLAPTAELLWRVTAKTLLGIGMLVAFIFSIFSALCAFIAKTCAAVFFLITNYHGKRSVILLNLDRSWKNIRTTITNLPIVTKITILSIFLIGFFLTTGIWYVRWQQEQIQEKQHLTSVTEKIKQILESAESALVYNNNTLAFQTVESAKQQLATLPCTTSSFVSTCHILSDSINTTMRRIEKINISQPRLISDLTSTAPGFGTVDMEIIRIKNKIIGFSTATGTLVIYDTLTKETSALSSPASVSGFRSGAVPKENDFGLLLSNQNELNMYTPEDNAMKKITVGSPPSLSSITDMAMYNRRLYTIAPNVNQIFKHDITRDGFSAGKTWLKTSLPLNGAKQLTIDGDIFTITASGTIKKFTKGAEAAFSMPQLSFTLSPSTRIFTYNDVARIYALDPIAHRLIVLEKNGTLVKQIMADVFTSPTGMIIDEPNRTAIIANKGKLYTIDL